MEFATTTISQNGQVVIPAGIRKELKLEPKTKLLIMQEGENIVLKRAEPVYKKEFLEAIAEAEADIAAGRTTRIPAGSTAEEIGRILFGEDSENA